MGKRALLAAKVGWLLLGLVILLYNCEPCGGTDYSCVQVADDFLGVMLLLTFPLGFGGAMFAAAVSYGLGNEHQVSSLVIWLAITGAGYLQWFVVVPAMLKKREVLTLGLTTPDRIAPTIEKAIEPKTRATVVIRIEPPMQVTQFDRRGQTRLERVIER